MNILSLKRKTPGGYHAWYETDLGFDVRKPIGDYIGQVKSFGKEIDSFFTPRIRMEKKRGWFRRLIDWLWRF